MDLIFWILIPIILLAVLFLLVFWRFLKPLPQDIEEAILQYAKTIPLAGAAYAGIKDKMIDREGCYGFANIEEKRLAGTDTLFTIASVSKTITGAAFLRLYEKGRFGLDDDINPYLPFVVRSPYFPDEPVTFRRLLTHTAAIRDTQAYEKSYTIKQKLEESPVSLAQFLETYFTAQPAQKTFFEYAPGTKFHYSNVAFGLVAYLVERISGMPFDQFCRKEVFDPLGMQNTCWFYRDAPQEKRAMPYKSRPVLRRFKPYGYYTFGTYADGALKTSVHEYSRFLITYLNGGVTLEGQIFLKPETMKEMLTCQFPNNKEKTGLVWFLEGQSTYQHGGGDPGVSTYVAFNPQTQKALIVFFNSGITIGLLLLFYKYYRDFHKRLNQFVEK